MKLENQISQFINQVSQREYLLGDCESQMGLTSTQEHILMLLSTEGKITNTKLAEELNISPAAVSKAVKVLQERDFISSDRNKNDERLIELSLSETGRPLADEHSNHHERTLATYRLIRKKFSKDEQALIARFLKELESVIK